MKNRKLYFDASPISYASFANNQLAVLLITGTEDDLVPPKLHYEPFLLALKQAGLRLQRCRARRAALLDE